MGETFNSLKYKITYKYFINTFGCQMNAHDSDMVMNMLDKLGYIKSKNEDQADIIIINTCCIRDTAEQRILSYLGKLRALKLRNSNLIIAVCGCLSQQKGYIKKLKNSFPFIDIIIGTHNLNSLYSFLTKRITENLRSFEISEIENEDFIGVERANIIQTFASVNIMQGCNNYCSYCIVPYVRGKERSRTAQSIINEICNLTKNGCKEILLLGQNVNSYKDGNITFQDLLQKISKGTNVERIRYMTSHPKDFSDNLINTISQIPKLCRNIHLPVQSGSSKILKLMNRGYTREDYLNLIRKIRNKLPGIALSTDIIVGFPGETEQDFNDTLSLITEVKFDSAFTFVYSKRSGTAAAEMPDQIPNPVRKERIIRLINLQNKITEDINKKYIGKIEPVLVEGISKRNNDHLYGRTDNGKTVNFKGNKIELGKFCDILITEAKKTTLFGVKV